MARPPLPPGEHGESWTRRLPDGRFYAGMYVRDAGGRRRRVGRTAATARAAKQALAVAAGAAAGSSTTTGPITAATRFSDAAVVWMDRKRERGVNATSLDHYRHRVAVLNTVMADLRVGELTVPRVSAVFDRLADGRAVSTLRAYRVVVEGVRRLAVQLGAIPDTGRLTDVLSGRRHAPKMPRSLTRVEVGALIDALRADPATPGWLADLVLIQVGTGLRIGEVLALRWHEDVDMFRPATEPAFITVSGNLVHVTGRGVVRNEGKTEAARRTLKLPEFVRARLVELRPVGPAPGWPVLTDRPDDPRWIAPAVAHRDMRAALDRAGYPWATSHVFRKTAATLLDDAGVSLRGIADQLGHSSTRITTDAYLGRQHDSGAAAALDRAWGVDKPR